MKFKEFKNVINRNDGRHEWSEIHIGLGVDALIRNNSPILDALDDYEVKWIAPCNVTIECAETSVPCIEIHLEDETA